MRDVCIRAAKERFDADDDFKTRARIAVTKLQNGEEAYLAAWRRICEASRKEFDAIYRRLGVELIERGESFYNPYLAPLVEELKSQEIVVESEGANVRRISQDVFNRAIWRRVFSVYLCRGTTHSVDHSEIGWRIRIRCNGYGSHPSSSDGRECRMDYLRHRYRCASGGGGAF